MQDAVEREVKRAQNAGFMSTKIKEIHYLKDPQLFDPARPTRRNPYQKFIDVLEILCA